MARGVDTGRRRRRRTRISSGRYIERSSQRGALLAKRSRLYLSHRPEYIVYVVAVSMLNCVLKLWECDLNMVLPADMIIKCRRRQTRAIPVEITLITVTQQEM